ncbi:2054_t:CDS:2, partial [Gigaspora rosea]
MNTKANRSLFDSIFRTQYTEPILNGSSISFTASSTLSTSSTNLKTLLLYIEKIAQKRRKSSTLTNKKDEFTQQSIPLTARLEAGRLTNGSALACRAESSARLGQVGSKPS